MSLKSNETTLDVTGRKISIGDKVCYITGWKRTSWWIEERKVDMFEVAYITKVGEKHKIHFTDGNSTVKPLIKVENGSRTKI